MNWQKKHRVYLSLILQAIYKKFKKELIFKGGTSMLFFLGLDRFSVDLDFELNFYNLDTNQLEKHKSYIFETINDIIKHNNLVVKKSYIKRNTIFWLVSYGDGSKNIKIEISTRNIIPVNIKLYNFYGLEIPVMDWRQQMAFKLVALCTRKQPRDLFDIIHYIKNGISPNKTDTTKIYTAITGDTKQFDDIVNEAKNIARNHFNKENLMIGLGDVLYDKKQKEYIRSDFLDQCEILLDTM